MNAMERLANQMTAQGDQILAELLKRQAAVFHTLLWIQADRSVGRSVHLQSREAEDIVELALRLVCYMIAQALADRQDPKTANDPGAPGPKSQ